MDVYAWSFLAMMPTFCRVSRHAYWFSRNGAYGVNEDENVQLHALDLSEKFANPFKSHQSASGHMARLRMIKRRRYMVTHTKVDAQQAAKGSIQCVRKSSESDAKRLSLKEE